MSFLYQVLVKKRVWKFKSTRTVFYCVIEKMEDAFEEESRDTGPLKAAAALKFLEVSGEHDTRIFRSAVTSILGRTDLPTELNHEPQLKRLVLFEAKAILNLLDCEPTSDQFVAFEYYDSRFHK